MSTQINQEAWQKAAEQHVREDLGGVLACEDCNKPLTWKTAVKHHAEIPRSRTSECNSWNVRIRCKECEAADPHKVAKGETEVPSNRFSVQIGEILKNDQEEVDSSPAGKLESQPRERHELRGRFAAAYDWGSDDEDRSQVKKAEPVPESKQESRFASSYPW